MADDDLYGGFSSFDPSSVPAPNIISHPGARLLYSAATGLERALADVDAERLLKIPGEFPKMQWNPWQIPLNNLPLLAWAMGVNLWEDDWTEEERRAWTARQWQMKAIRGTREGLDSFVRAIHGNVKRVVTPPAFFYGGKATTAEERAAFVARFPQLRVYPFAPQTQLPYLCYLGKGHKNGSFLGPYRIFAPMNQHPGGLYLRRATLWDRGVETDLTFRTITKIDQGPQYYSFVDEIELPGHKNSIYHAGQRGRFLRPADSIRTGKTGFGIFLGRFPGTEPQMVRIARDGSLEYAVAKAQFQTVRPISASSPDDLINVYPEHKNLSHPIRKTELYARRGQFICGKFLPKSNSWKYVYEVWYIFDRDRLPDARKASIYVGHCRLGMHKYTAEAKVAYYHKWPSHFLRAGGFVRGFMPPPDDSRVQKIRRAVRASKRAVDKILIDTRTRRTLEVRDWQYADGSHTVGQMVSD